MRYFLVLSESRQRQWIVDRCWQIYDLITDTFATPSEFHVEFPELAEVASLTSLLQLRVPISLGYFLHIEEEYDIRNGEFVIERYSYMLLDEDHAVVIRADPLPHHQVDYKKQQLRFFPHHLHDERGRVCSFTGRVEDFVTDVRKRQAG